MKTLPAREAGTILGVKMDMHSLFIVLLIGLGFVSVLPARAADVFDGLPDPTRPSGWSDNGGAPAREGLVLQSTTVSPRQRVAVINGQRLSVGDAIQGASVTDIQPFQATLRRAGREITLRLMPPLAKEKR
jgi:hypothetical protein